MYNSYIECKYMQKSHRRDEKNVELRHLRYFLMIAREGTISGAAAALHVSQPSLSRQMQELERDLGVRLFDRGSRRVTLTEPGMRLRRRAEEIVDLVGRTEDEFRLTAETLAGEVRIGGGETPAMGLLADVMSGFADAYPLVRFSLFSGNAGGSTLACSSVMPTSRATSFSNCPRTIAGAPSCVRTTRSPSSTA